MKGTQQDMLNVSDIGRDCGQEKESAPLTVLLDDAVAFAYSARKSAWEFIGIIIFCRRRSTLCKSEKTVTS